MCSRFRSANAIVTCRGKRAARKLRTYVKAVRGKHALNMASGNAARKFANPRVVPSPRVKLPRYDTQSPSIRAKSHNKHLLQKREGLVDAATFAVKHRSIPSDGRGDHAALLAPGEVYQVQLGNRDTLSTASSAWFGPSGSSFLCSLLLSALLVYIIPVCSTSGSRGEVDGQDGVRPANKEQHAN